LEGASGDISTRTQQQRTVHIKWEDVKML
jgi:hypothetical protein